MENNNESQQQLFTVSQFASVPEFSYLGGVPSIRNLIFNSRPRYSAGGAVILGNGLVEAGAIIRLGRKILISAPEFRAWTLKQREQLTH